MNANTMNKILDWIVKLAGMVIYAPVTWLAVGVFTDVQLPLLRVIMQLSAVLLVEGVLRGN